METQKQINEMEDEAGIINQRVQAMKKVEDYRKDYDLFYKEAN